MREPMSSACRRHWFSHTDAIPASQSDRSHSDSETTAAGIVPVVPNFAEVVIEAVALVALADPTLAALEVAAVVAIAVADSILAAKVTEAVVVAMVGSILVASVENFADPILVVEEPVAVAEVIVVVVVVAGVVA